MPVKKKNVKIWQNLNVNMSRSTAVHLACRHLCSTPSCLAELRARTILASFSPHDRPVGINNIVYRSIYHCSVKSLDSRCIGFIWRTHTRSSTQFGSRGPCKLTIWSHHWPITQPPPAQSCSWLQKQVLTVQTFNNSRHKKGRGREMPTKCLLKIKRLLHVGASNQIYLFSPVTFVPMTKCKGISSGRSFRLLNSVSLRCCSNRIFSRLSCSARLSSSKNDGEHLHIKHLCTLQFYKH